jgi:gamma-glutamyl hercynylcysteine S-oxide synthase
MSTRLTTLAQLRGIHNRLRALVLPLDEAEIRQQFHPELSPIGWHLGHCCFIENYWLREGVQGDNSKTGHLHDLYFPERSPKAERGGKLPDKEKLLEQTLADHEQNLLLLSGMAEPLQENRLLEDDYLPFFLIQHHVQHYETMLMVLTQRAYARHRQDFFPQQHLTGKAPIEDYISLPECTYPVGGALPMAFDNELPAHSPELSPFAIRRMPVSNAEYLGFMEAGAYENQAFWSEEGWAWLAKQPVSCPEHWRQDARGWWYGLSKDGPCELPPDEPVYGINHYEAEAFARYAGGRLPHEHEWEAAKQLHSLQQTGVVWEWCENPFAPYPDYISFPYDRYSKAWFDDHHYVLKGGSRYTRPIIKRPSFRNFYTPDKRHIFAGCRLARSDTS